MSSYILIDPDSKLDLQHDWAAYLGEGQTIASRLWTISPLNGTSPETPILTNPTGDVVIVESCQAGKIYKLVERITTSAGTKDDRTIVLRCEST